MKVDSIVILYILAFWKKIKERKEERKKEIAATLQNIIQIFGTWLPAFQKGRGSNGVESRTLKFVLDYTYPSLDNK